MVRQGAITLGLPLLLSYGVITIAAGHGMAPAGLVLTWIVSDLAATETWALVFAILGLLGALLLGASLLALRPRAHLGLCIGGWLALTASAVLFASNTEDLPGTLLTTIPFCALSVVWWIRLVRQGKAAALGQP